MKKAHALYKMSNNLCTAFTMHYTVQYNIYLQNLFKIHYFMKSPCHFVCTISLFMATAVLPICDFLMISVLLW